MLVALIIIFLFFNKMSKNKIRGDFLDFLFFTASPQENTDGLENPYCYDGFFFEKDIFDELVEDYIENEFDFEKNGITVEDLRKYIYEIV